MKNRFSLPILSASAVLLAFCLTSCVKADILDPAEDPATRSDYVIIDPPLIDTSIKLELVSPIVCMVGDRVIDDKRLYVGTTYKFEYTSLVLLPPAGLMPPVSMGVEDSAGNLIDNIIWLGSSFSTSFSKPGQYTVVAWLNESLGGKTYRRTFNVVETGLSVSTAKLQVPFYLYINTHSLSADSEVSLTVEETVFNDPKCTVNKVADDCFAICINEPGAYKFKTSYKGELMRFPPVYHVNVFYRPRLVCESRDLANGAYSNFLHRPSIQEGPFERWGFLEHRFCADYSRGGGSFAAKINSENVARVIYGLYAEKDDNGISLPDTQYQMSSTVFVKGESSWIPNGAWTLIYPRDTCYVERRGIIDIPITGI